jgi:hypothetical protein
MLYALAPLALAAIVAANPVPQAASGECSANYDGTFQIQVVNQTTPTKRMAFEKRQSKALTISLKDGVLTDDQGRTGSIVANEQFQFDNPVQEDAIYTSGWSVCNNGSLSIGGDSTFYQCLSGTFYNLYDEATAEQCSPVSSRAINQGSGSASQIPDGQVTATPVVSQIPDGQITGSAVAPVTQIGDGQIQAPTGSPVTQIGDGQIQAPTGSPVSQIADGQIQAPTGSPVSQIADGQIQAPTGSPVTQIADGQIQAPTGTPVSQIADGQIQAPTGNGTMPQTPSATYSAPAEYTGAASHLSAGLFGFAGVVAVAML